MILEELDLYLTNRCNLHCDFCSVQANNNIAEISFNKIKDIIKTAVHYDLKELHLTGGEPTLRSDLEDIIEFSTAADLNVRLITNGTTLNKDRLTKLVKCGLKSIMISLDGMEDYHNSVRGNNTYKKTVQAITSALALNMFVRVNSVAWLDNQNEIIQLSDFLNDMGVDVYSIFLGSPLGYARTKKDNVMDPMTWRKFYITLQENVKRKKYHMKVVVEKGYIFSDEPSNDLSSLQGRGRGCYQMTNYYDYFLIQSNGNVYPCVFYGNEANPIGNINESSFDEVLQSFEKSDFYKEMGQFPTDCEKCEKLLFCKGGCRGYAKLYSEKWMCKDPRCVQQKPISYFPVCPIVKYNLNEDRLGGSSEQALRK